MVYKNFYLRLLFSFIFLIIYCLINYINFEFIFYLILFIYAILILEIYFYFVKYKILPLIYILISLTFFLNINFSNEFILNFNLYVFIVIFFDTFSYLTGKFYGKKKIINISPNKTFEGLLGGIFISLISSILFAIFFDIEINLQLFIFIVLIITSAFSGDIIESYFKRKNNLKNSSSLIPGHGGIFDRFDSFLFSIIFYSLFMNI